MATITLHYISAQDCVGKTPHFPISDLPSERSADKGKLVSVSLLLALAFATIASMDMAVAILMATRQYQYMDFFSFSMESIY